MSIFDQAFSKGKTVIQYQNQKSLSKLENEGKEMMEKTIGDIEDLKLFIQNIIDHHSHDKDIQQDFRIIEKQISLLCDRYFRSIGNEIEE